MIPSVSLDIITFYISTGASVWVACLAGCIFAPDSEISSMLVLVGLGWVSIYNLLN